MCFNFAISFESLSYLCSAGSWNFIIGSKRLLRQLDFRRRSVNKILTMFLPLPFLEFLFTNFRNKFRAWQTRD